MKASTDSVVTFHYTLTVDGQPFEDSRRGGQPLDALLGHGQLVAGMEKALLGHAAGEAFGVDLTPDEAYGERREDAIQRLSKKIFDKGTKLAPGVSVTLRRKDGGVMQATVHKVGMTTVDVDLNHPLAGKSLHFDIELIDVREASEEERAHGHAHGPGGHQH